MVGKDPVKVSETDLSKALRRSEKSPEKGFEKSPKNTNDKEKDPQKILNKTWKDFK